MIVHFKNTDIALSLDKEDSEELAANLKSINNAEFDENTTILITLKSCKVVNANEILCVR